MSMSSRAGSLSRDSVTCRSKTRFANPSDAARVARKIGSTSDAAFHHYPCAVCGGWHVGGLMVSELKRNRGRGMSDPPDVLDELELWELDIDIGRIC